MRVGQFTVLGVKYPSEVTVSNLSVDPSLNIIKKLPADMNSIYDLTSITSTLTGHVYTGSSQENYYPPAEAFDNVHAWENAWRSVTQYNSTSGNYYGNKFTGPYKGEWLQVDLSENVVIGEYKILAPNYNHAAYYYSCPKKSYLLSSLDGKKWNLVHIHDVTSFSSSYGSHTGNVTYTLNGDNCKGRYFRLVTEKLFRSNSSYLHICGLEIKGIKESENSISSQSLANSYNTFTNTSTPYVVSSRNLRHTTLPYLISSEKTTLISVDVSSPASTLTSQNYTASLGTANKAFDNDDPTHWDISGNFKYNIFETLRTNEPNFTGWTLDPSAGLLLSFSENVQSGTTAMDTNDFSMVDNTQPNSTILSTDISNGKVLVNIAKSFTYNDSVTEYDLASTNSTLMTHVTDQNKTTIYTASSYYNTSYYPYEAFDAYATSNNDNCWISINNSYANQVNTNNIITVVDGTDVMGEWLQVELPENVIVKTFKYVARPTTLDSIQEAVLVVSKNGTTWTQIGSITRILENYTNTTEETYSTTAHISGKYVRLIIVKNWTAVTATVGELTLLGQKQSEATPIIITSHNNLKLTYNKNASKDKNIIGATNNVAVNLFSAIGGTLLNRGLYFTDSLATNEPNFTSSQVVGGKLEYTFSENLQAGSGGLDITDFQLIDNSGMVIDISNNGTSITGGKLVIASYVKDYTLIGNEYDLASDNATHENISLRYYDQGTNRGGWEAEHLYDDNEATQWLGYEATGYQPNNLTNQIYNGITAYNGWPQMGMPALLSTNMVKTNNNSWNGDWLKVDMGETVIVSEIKLYPRPNTGRYASIPKQGVIVSSNDGHNWDLVGSFSGMVRTDWYDDTNWLSKDITVTGSSFRTARWFALVVEKTLRGGGYGGSDVGYANIGEFEIYGVTKTEQDGGSPPAAYNLAVLSRAGLRDRRYYASSQYGSSTNWTAFQAFDGDTVDNGDRAWTSVNGTHYNETGDYIGPNSIASGPIRGNWAEVDMGINTIVTDFTLAIHSEMKSSAGRVAGSLDGETFTTVGEFKHTYDVDPSYVTININSNDYVPYRYYRLIIENMYGYQRVRIMKWMLNGYTKTHYYVGETINDIDYSLIYNKNASGTKNIIGATNSVTVNNFRIDNDYLVSRGNASNIGLYNAATTTTLADTSTYTGEWIQIDIGENVFLDTKVITIPAGYTPLKSYLLLSSLDGSSWTKLYEITDSNETLTFQSKKGRYVRLAINKITTDVGFPKLTEFKINGTIIKLEGQTYSASLDNGDVNTVFNNSIITSWDTSSAYNYNGIDAAASNEATYSSVALHQDASGNNKIELTFSADLSSNGLKGTDFIVTETDFSTSIPLLTDISGGKLLIERQANIQGSVFYEDFDDQVILGEVTTADIVQKGLLNGQAYDFGNTAKTFTLTNGASFHKWHAMGGSKICEINGKYYTSGYTMHIDEINLIDASMNRITTGGRQNSTSQNDNMGHAMFAYNNRLYMYGGGAAGTQLDKYDISTDTWTFNITTTGSAPSFTGGGWAMNGPNKVIFHYVGATDELDLTTMTWTRISTTQGSITNAKWVPTFVYNNRFYTYGAGPYAYGRYSDLQYLDLANPSNGWTSVTINDPNNLRAGQGSFFGGWPRNANGVAVKDGKMYYVGGYDQYFDWYDNIAHYIDLTNETVYEIRPGLSFDASLHGIRHTHYFIGDILYLFGAGTSNTTSGGANGWNGAGKNELLQIDITKTTPADFGYRLQGEKNIPKIWRIVDQTFLALSFWYKNGTGSSIFDSYNSTDSDATYSGGDGRKDWLYKNANKLRLRTRNPANIERWYQNGVVCSTPPGTNSSGHGTDGHTTMAVDSWHHVYIEFKTANDRIQFFARDTTTPNNGDDGSIDQLRFYDRAISEAHIKEMVNGWNGMYPGASFDKTDYLIEYNKNTSSAHNIYDVNNTTVPINDFIIRNGSLISRGTNYGHYSGSTTTTLADSSTSTGEYIEVNIGEQTYIINYELHVPASNVHMDNNVYPKSWILLGSTNGSAWTKIHEVTDYAGWATNSHYGSGYKVNYMNEITNMTAQYYRLIINKTYGKVGYTSVAELLINGVKHTSETTGITLTKTASLGTAANAFDSNISTDWNTSSSATYSLIAAPATNEPTFSSVALNSGKLELTFSENVAVTGTLKSSDFNITDSGTKIYVTPTIDNNKLVLEYLGIPTSQIYLESFDNEDVTFHANADIVYVDGRGGGKAMSTIGQSPSGLQWEKKVSAGNLPADVRAVSFHIKTSGVYDSSYIFDNRDGDGNTDNRALWFQGSALKFWNNTSTNGTASGSGYLPSATQPSIYIDGTLQLYGTNNSSTGAPVGDIDFTTLSDGNWHHFYIEYPAGETLPKEFNWLTRFGGGGNLQATIDDLRYYDAPILQANIDNLATGGTGGLAGSFTDTNVDIGYTKNATTAQNIVNAAHTSVPTNTFFLSNGVEMSRGSTGIGDYRGSTSTTLPDSSTYDGEWIQIDVGQTILMTDFSLVVPNKDAYTNPKSWKLLISPDNTNWIEVLDISGNTVWDSGFGSASSDYSGFQVGSGLINNYIGRYFKVIVNSIIGPANQVKINEIVIKGVSHTLETQSVVGDQPILYTTTESSNTTSQNTVVTTTTHNTDDTTVTTVTETTVDISANTVTKTTTKKTTNTVVAPVAEPTVSASNNTSSNTDSTVTTTTHNADDTTITTVTETTVDIATNTVTTTTTKTTVTTAISAVTLNTATPSSTNAVHSDTTALTTTYNNNDTSVRTVVNRSIDISANTDTTTNLNTIITTTVSGFGVISTSGSSFDPNKIYDASGVACPALKSIYEQLMNIPGRSQIMESQDFSTSPMPSVETITGGFPFIAGDKLVMYIRPKIKFAQSTFPEQFTSLIGFGDKALGSPAVDIALASGSGGGVTGQTYTKSSEFSGTYAVSKLFDGNTGSIWITASDTYNSGTQVAEEYYSGGHLFDDGGSRSLSLNHSLENSHEDFDNENPTGTVGAGVTYVTGHGGTGKALSTIGVSGVSPFIQSGLNGSKAVSFWFYGDTTAANMNSTILFDTRTNSGPNFALNYPDGYDNLYMWTGGGYTGIEGIYINGYLQTIDGAYSGNFGSKIGGDNTTKASLSGVWTHIFVNFSPGVTTINDVTWLSRYTSGQVVPGYLDDVRWFAGALNDDEITNLSSGGSGNIGRNIINYFGHYAQIAFTESMAAETLKLTPRSGGGGGAGEPVDFRLLVLEDDNDPTWTSVLKVTESDIAVNWNKNGNDWATHEWLIPLSTAQGKYWRLVINKISTGNKVQLAKMELMGGLTSELTGGGDQAAALSIPGLETNVTNQATTFPVLFPGNTTGGNEAEAQKFGWVGSANADSLSLETTDETDTRTMDLHIWKITITL